jgi:DNA replication licensing factor MCM3
VPDNVGYQRLYFEVSRTDEEEETPVFEKTGRRLTGRARTRTTQDEVLTTAFLKKYIHYAKSRMRPVLTKAASDYIVSAYAELRNAETPESRHKVSLL